ncbi:MAG: GNAT family N-acetyltransferase [Flavobacteriaceae bacterium]|nr:GNAT family N-acetyltransferase [Flavobacteriaceae bacterium]
MITFKKIEKSQYSQWKKDLKDLYLQTFTQGLSAQHIEELEAEQYLDQLFSEGYGICGFDKSQLVATLIAVPPSLDREMPESLSTQFNTSNSLYIAEVLVAETHRGLGLGKKMFQKFELELPDSIHHVLLRVWDKNEIAIQLYQKQGFEVCGEMVQQKLKPLTKEKFEMHKKYMIKTYQ